MHNHNFLFDWKTKTPCLVFCICLYLPFYAVGFNVGDSTKIARDSVPILFNEHYNTVSNIDTTLYGLQRYNNAFAIGNFTAVNGHISLPSRPLFFIPDSAETLRFGSDQYSHLFYNNNRINYFQTYYPVTEVKAVIGSKKEQLVELWHSQNITPRCNIGFKILGLRTAGYYGKQQTNTAGFQAFTSYLGKQQRYVSFFSYCYNKAVIQVNGGLVPDSAGGYVYPGLIDKNLIPVFLNSAKQQVYGSDVYTKQIFGLDKKIKPSELFRRNIDSLVALNKLSVDFRYRQYHRTYEAQNEFNDYYPNFFFYDLMYKEKVLSAKTSANLTLFNTQNQKAVSKHFGYLLQAGAENLSVIIRDYEISYRSAFAKVLLAKNIGKLAMNVSGSYYFYGYNTGNREANASIGNMPGKKISWSIYAGFSEKNPDLLYQYFSSNNYYWFNNFGSQKNQYAALRFGGKKVGNFVLQASAIQNYTYFDTLAMPAQSDTTIRLIQCSYHKLFKLNALCFIPELLFQRELDNTKLLGLPELYAKASLFLEHRLFRKNLWLQYGFDGFWLYQYTPYAYMPATNSYYLQTTPFINQLPLVDFFVNMKIKTVRVFFKLEQISTIGTNPYFFVPGYAMPGLTYKLGINWLFLD